MKTFVIALLLWIFSIPAYSADSADESVTHISTLTLVEALTLALERDPWRVGSELREQALVEASEANAQLPDPRIKLMAGNLPVDSWSLAQEPMTQLSVGVQQVIPRGDSLSLTRERGYQRVDEERSWRSDRAAQVKLQVTQLWLDVLQAVMTRDRLIAGKPLLRDLETLTQDRYQAGMVGASQADLLRTSVELARLEERITRADQQLALSQQRLFAWIGERAYAHVGQLPAMNTTSPKLSALFAVSTQASDATLFDYVAHHPRLRALGARVEVANTDVAIAQESVKPAWTVEASYGYRADDAQGRHRADLFSVGLSFDVPIFTSQRQDRSIRASKATAASLETDRQLLTRDLLEQLRASLVSFQHAQTRYINYVDSLIPQLRLQVETELLAYNNDQADLAEAIIATITALDTDIECIEINIERHRALANVGYLTQIPVFSMIATRGEGN